MSFLRADLSRLREADEAARSGVTARVHGAVAVQPESVVNLRGTGPHTRGVHVMDHTRKCVLERDGERLLDSEALPLRRAHYWDFMDGSIIPHVK